MRTKNSRVPFSLKYADSFIGMDRTSKTCLPSIQLEARQIPLIAHMKFHSCSQRCIVFFFLFFYKDTHFENALTLEAAQKAHASTKQSIITNQRTSRLESACCGGRRVSGDPLESSYSRKGTGTLAFSRWRYLQGGRANRGCRRVRGAADRKE